MSKSESFYLLFLLKMEEKENLQEVVVENEEVISEEDLQFFIECDNSDYFNEYEYNLLAKLY